MRTASKPNSELLIQLNIDSTELLNQLNNLLDKHSINTTNITNNTNTTNTTNNTNIANTINIANNTNVANNTDVANNTNVANNTDVANTTNINNNNNNDKDIKKCRILNLLIKKIEEDELADKFRPIYLFIYLLTR